MFYTIRYFDIDTGAEGYVPTFTPGSNRPIRLGCMNAVQMVLNAFTEVDEEADICRLYTVEQKPAEFFKE